MNGEVMLQTIANRVMELRHGKNLTQAQFANLIGVSRTSVTMYESATSFPSVIVLARIAKQFNVTTDWILGLT